MAMDPTKLRSWLAARIEEHAPSTTRPGDAAQLVVAAQALRGEPGRSMAFGLELPPEGVLDPEPLFARCLELLRAWEPIVPPQRREDLARARAELEVPFGAYAPAAREGTHVLRVWCPVVLDDSDSDEELIYDAPELLRSFDRAKLRSRVDLLDLPCLREASGGDAQKAGWAFGGEAALAFDEATTTLRARLTFHLERAPSHAELERFLAAIRDELFFTSWGLNLEWDCVPEPETLCIHVRPEIARFEVEMREYG